MGSRTDTMVRLVDVRGAIEVVMEDAVAVHGGTQFGVSVYGWWLNVGYEGESEANIDAQDIRSSVAREVMSRLGKLAGGE